MTRPLAQPREVACIRGRPIIRHERDTEVYWPRGLRHRGYRRDVYWTITGARHWGEFDTLREAKEAAESMPVRRPPLPPTPVAATV